MMKRFLLQWFFPALLIMMPHISVARQDPATVQGKGDSVLGSVLEKDSILIGDQVWWNMTLPPGIWTEGIIETPEFPSLPFEITRGIEALSGVRLDSVFRKKNLESIRARILLTSFDSGSYQLPPVPVRLLRQDGTADTLWFKGPLLKVQTIPVDTTSFEPYGLKPQMRYPITTGEILALAGIVALVTGLVFLALYIIRRRRKNLPLFGPVRPKDPPHIAALKVLANMRRQEIWKKQKAKLYYTLLTDTIRVYLRDRWGMQAMELTSGEMIASLEQRQPEDPLLSGKIIEVLREMLSMGDLAKFAKYTPSESENEESLRQAVRFVTETARYEEEKEE